MAKIDIGGNSSDPLKTPNITKPVVNRTVNNYNTGTKKVPDSGIAGLASTQPSKAVTTAPQVPAIESHNTGSWLDPAGTKTADPFVSTKAKTYEDVKPADWDFLWYDDALLGMSSEQSSWKNVSFIPSGWKIFFLVQSPKDMPAILLTTSDNKE